MYFEPISLTTSSHLGGEGERIVMMESKSRRSESAVQAGILIKKRLFEVLRWNVCGRRDCDVLEDRT